MNDYIQYMDRTRAYYEAQGFDRPYRWAHHDDVPFCPPRKSLAESRVALITTAIHPVDADAVMISRTAKSFPMAEVPARFHTDDLSWDKVTTHTEDRESYFPINALAELSEQGIIGEIAPRFHFVPTEYSQRHTIEADGPAIRQACIEDEVDVALLVPL